MTSILEAFAYGNITPGFQCFEKRSKYGRLLRGIAHREERLLERLEGEDKKALGSYIDARNDAESIVAVNNFICGFKLGLTMTAEAFLTSGDLIASEDG